MKKTYYDITNLLSTKAQYMLLLGQRANGKSYQAKKTVLENAYKNNKKFVYLRRWKDDVKAASVEKYFADMPIEKITKGEYDHIKAWHNNLYFAQHDGDKEVRGPEIGMYGALNEAERYKSWAFTDPKTNENFYDYIIYEEFITDKLYLVDEPTRLQQFVSTVFRHYAGTVLMVGNTLSRVCPYFSEWSLEGTLKQKIGTIEIYHYDVGEGQIIDIAVEYCANTATENKMFFGQAAKQIISGEWETHNLPKLPSKIENYEMIYEVLLKYQTFKFVMQLMIEPNEGGCFLYVYPLTTRRYIQRVITDTFSDSLWVTSKLDITKKPEAMIAKCIKLRKICYSDNLTGTDFNNVINTLGII